MDHGRVYEFGSYRLDAGLRRLERDGQPVRLAPKAFDILVILIERRDRVVEKGELMRLVWPASFVEEANLSQTIFVLRKTLGAQSDGRPFIETAPRHGYRFAGAVHEWSPPAAVSVPDAPPRRRFRWAAAAGAMVGALAAFALFHFWQNHPAGRDRPTDRPVVIAVLPFENQTDGPEQEYFSEGFTEETVTHLSRVNPARLAVIARTTIQRYAASGKTLSEIGAAVGATHVVEGRVRREGERVRLTARLTEVAGQTNVWAESYDRDIRDILIVQQEIALAIAGAIDRTLSASAHPARRPGLVDAEAYQLYLKGRFFWNHRRPDSAARAREYFEQAVERDPSLARGYAGLGDIELMRGGPGAPGALAFARKALALDPSLAEAHTTVGHAAMHLLDWSSAGASLERAIQLDASYVPARYFYAEYLVANGRFEAAIAEARRGVVLDPAGSIANHALGTVLYYSRRYDEAARQFRLALELDPNHYWSHARLGQVFEQQGRYDDAIREFSASGLDAARARISARAGRPDDARSVARSANASGSPYELAVLLVVLGESEAALDALARAATLPSYDIVYVAVDPKLDALRSSPRFREVLARVGLSHLPVAAAARTPAPQ